VTDDAFVCENLEAERAVLGATLLPDGASALDMIAARL
jgi:hypothetical protein